MAIENTRPEDLRKLAEWLDQPLTAAKERELNTWLADNPDNQVTWDRWIQFNASAKRLQVKPVDVGPSWDILKGEIGFERSVKKKKSRRSSSGKKTFLRTPSVVAILSMCVYAMFLLILHLIRTNSEF
jgi:hypothetical protein